MLSTRGVPANCGDAPPRGAQTAVELTYQLLVTGWLTIQPDAQLLLTRDGTAGVLAARAVVAL